MRPPSPCVGASLPLNWTIPIPGVSGAVHLHIAARPGLSGCSKPRPDLVAELGGFLAQVHAHLAVCEG